MTKIETVSQLWQAWKDIGERRLRDIHEVHSLRVDPVGTFRKFGYLLTPPARRALLSALP